MNKPDQLLVTQKAFLQGIWYLRCINCGKSREADWHLGDPWHLFCGLKETIVVRISDDGCETAGFPDEPLVIYGIDPVIESMPSSVRATAIVAQNYTVLLSSDDLTDFSLPRFISHIPISTVRLELEARFTCCFIEDLPDVIEFERRMAESGKFDKFMRMFNPESRDSVRIPPGFMLPVTIESFGTESASVYAVKEWRSETDAIIECFVPGNVIVDENTVLVRRIANSPGKVEIARIAKSQQST